MKTGVIVGRFQTPYLHLGHCDLINQVQQLCDRLVIFVGVTPVKMTRKDPLDFVTIKHMIANKYPQATILALPDQKSDEEWSKTLDLMVEGCGDVTLYGARDSFIPYYKGKHPTRLIHAIDVNHNASELRRIASEQPRDHKYFREGMIYGAFNRYPISYQCVDIALIDTSTEMILLGRKPGEKLFRFPGGFVDPVDESLEQAAKREASEECTGLEIDGLTYINSRRVDDWRYRGREDKIMTTLFAATVVFGHAKAGDDLEEVKWFPLMDFQKSKSELVPEHAELMNDLLNHFYVKK